MKSYKCPQCGFVGLATKTHCKSCNAPNPNPVNGLETFTRPIQVSTPQAVVYETPSVPSPQYQAVNEQYSYNSPPPPTEFGADYGTAYNADRPRREHPISRFRPAPAYNHSAEMEAAEADIRKGWKAGRAWCILIGILLGGMTFIFMLIAPSAFMVIPLLIMMPFLAIVGGLSFGIYKKSRACAVILASLTGLGLLGNILTLLTEGGKGAIPLIISALFFYYFCLGVRGTFKYHKLMGA